MDFCIAIHNRPGSFSDRWIEYCTEHNINHRVVNCYASDIINQLRSVDALLWHSHHSLLQDAILANHLVKAAESMGLLVFPSTPTCWHFDDKVAQKYLLEAVGAPIVPTYVFYDRASAEDWIRQTLFPKVFKLRKGAGSQNVRLVRSASEAKQLTSQAFGRGFRPLSAMPHDIPAKMAKHRRRGDTIDVIKRMPKILAKGWRISRSMLREKGYVYFQDFLADNKMDTRITIIGDRAFGFTRRVRDNDFRASGSGRLDYELDKIDLRCVKIAFDVAARIGAQSMAFDFLKESSGEPKIAEVCYCYDPSAVHACLGHWDCSLAWQEGQIWPQDAILEDMLEAIRRKKACVQ